jgi:glycosyltransferase involved in cell wall biosynthesis
MAIMTDRIRVLELRSVCGPGGGPEKTILLGAARADRRRFSVTVCYIRDQRDPTFDIARRAEHLGLDYVEIPERHSVDPSVLPAVCRLVRERGIDIIHAHEYKTDLLALLAARATGAVPLATMHGWTGHSFRERFFYYALDKRLLRAFPLTIAVSSEIRSELVRHNVPEERVRVVLNGIDHRAFRRDRSAEPRVRRELGVAPSDIVVGAVGRLEPQKRFDLLIRACAALRHRWPQLRLMIGGDGSQRGELQKLATSMLPGNACQLLGHRPDVANLHHAFNVFAQSSDYEGTPNSVLEAMAFETPLVATAAGGTAEIVEDGVHGLIVSCGDVDGLAAAMERTLVEPEATAQRVARARHRVETTSSFDERVAAVERIYIELAARFRRPVDRHPLEQSA